MNAPNFYLLALGIILVALALIVVRFEGRKPRAREIVVLAVMTALAVAGRAAFFMLPQFKPVAALVIISGVALGAESGFLVGVLAAFVSNFIFGQGPWTPFQMLAFGLIGLLAGLLFYRGDRGTYNLDDRGTYNLSPILVTDYTSPCHHIPSQLTALRRSKRGSRFRLAMLGVYGGVAVLVLYGLIVDMAYLLIFSESVSTETLLATLASGLPFNILHAVATVFFLFVLARPLLEKLERVKLKFGLMDKRALRVAEQGRKAPGAAAPVAVLLGLVLLMALFAPQSAWAQPNSNDSSANTAQSAVDPAADVRAHLIEASRTGEVVTFGYEGTPQQPTYIWTFDGAQLKPSQAEQLPPLDLGITVTQRVFVGEAIDTLTLDFAWQGDLPLPATLAVALSAPLDSTAALSLYRYDTSAATYVLVQQPVTIEDGYASFTITSAAPLALSAADLSTVGSVGQPSSSSSDPATSNLTETNPPSPQPLPFTPWLLPVAVSVVLIIIGVAILMRLRRARAIAAMRAGFQGTEMTDDAYFREIPSIEKLIADEIEEPNDSS
jgi:hypothetical protein